MPRRLKSSKPERDLGPAYHRLTVQKVQHDRLDPGRSLCAMHGSCDDRITAVVESDRQRRLRRARRAADGKRTAAALHPGHRDLASGSLRGKLVAQQVVITDAVELIVVRDARAAVAEADLGPDVDGDLSAAVGRLAAKRLALA